MQQGDCNAPTTFQQLMTWVFREYIGIFIRVYLDDMFVYLDSLDDHEKHLEIAFRVLQEHRLFLSCSKCNLYSEDMDCLGHQIDDQGLHANSDKMPWICEWCPVQSYPEVLRFLGLVNYLAHFMPDISAYTSPLEAICSNGLPFYWNHCIKLAWTGSRTLLGKPWSWRP